MRRRMQFQHVILILLALVELGCRCTKLDHEYGIWRRLRRKRLCKIWERLHTITIFVLAEIPLRNPQKNGGLDIRGKEVKFFFESRGRSQSGRTTKNYYYELPKRVLIVKDENARSPIKNVCRRKGKKGFTPPTME